MKRRRRADVGLVREEVEEEEEEEDWWWTPLGSCWSTKSVCRNLGLPTSGSTGSAETNTLLMEANNCKGICKSPLSVVWLIDRFDFKYFATRFFFFKIFKPVLLIWRTELLFRPLLKLRLLSTLTKFPFTQFTDNYADPKLDKAVKYYTEGKLFCFHLNHGSLTCWHACTKSINIELPQERRK